MLEVYASSEWYDVNTGKDFALLLLKTPLDLTVNEVGPVCLPSVNVYDGEYCYSTGWGSTEGKLIIFRTKPPV